MKKWYNDTAADIFIVLGAFACGSASIPMIRIISRIASGTAAIFECYFAIIMAGCLVSGLLLVLIGILIGIANTRNSQPNEQPNYYPDDIQE